jgi:hypothetical protein
MYGTGTPLYYLEIQRMVPFTTVLKIYKSLPSEILIAQDSVEPCKRGDKMENGAESVAKRED